MSEFPLKFNASLIDAVRVIESSRRRIAVVVDDENVLLGTLTDGDVRRCLLAGGTMQTIVESAMNRSPITAPNNSSISYLLKLMKKGNILAVPIVDEYKRFQRLIHLSDIDTITPVQTGVSDFAFAVIMAGGEGTRLRPITETIPKPMVKIGGTPLLERQIQRLKNAGVNKVYLSVNYLSHIIEEYFGDGSEYGIEIKYLHEKEKLGTAGALSLLPEMPNAPIIVMNGDILTTTDFENLYSFHVSHGARVTVSAVDYNVIIPYGVISADGVFVKELMEKPSQRFLCNAGIYVLSPEALELLQGIQYCNMTDIIESCLTLAAPVAVFPMHEYWSDIGTPDDLEKAREVFSRLEFS